jgi:hypothetical protein
MPAARYALPFILTLTNLHVQATTTATVTVIGIPETSMVYMTPMLSTATAISDIDTDILNNNNNNNNTDQCNNNNNSIVIIIIIIVIIIIIFDLITNSTPATNNTDIDDNVPP